MSDIVCGPCSDGEKAGTHICVPYIRLTTGTTRERKHVVSFD